MVTLSPSPKLQFFDSNSIELAGGKLYTYAAGTTTPLATYTDSTGSVPNTNPVILNSRGEASVWLGSSLYYMELHDSLGTLIWSADNIGGNVTLASLAASSGSALIGFIQAGTGAVAQTVQGKLRERVSVFDFMTAAEIANVQSGTLLVNVSIAIKTAYEALASVGGGDLILPCGNYNIGTTTLVFDKENIRIKGQGIPNRNQGISLTPKATTITYTGTGTAIELGKFFPAGTGVPFVFGVSFENVQVSVAPTTAIGIHLKGAAYGEMKFVTVFGNSGATRIGVKASGLISYIFTQIDVQGYFGAGGIPANFLATGMFLTQSITSDTSAVVLPSSAVDFHRCYFHYCSVGFQSEACLTTTMYDCDYEACSYGYIAAQQSNVRMHTPHFEANLNADIYIAAAATGNAQNIYVDGAFFNAGSRANFFDGAGAAGSYLNFTVVNSNFASSAANPYLFTSLFITQIANDAKVSLANNWFSVAASKAAVRISNVANGVGESKFVRFTDMPITLYRFTYDNLTAALAATAMKLAGASVKGYFPDAGHIIGVNAYYSAPITAGTFIGRTKYNGAEIVPLAAFSSPQTIYSSPLINKVVIGGTLEVTIETSPTFAPTGGTMTIETIVAHGKDGTEAY